MLGQQIKEQLNQLAPDKRVSEVSVEQYNEIELTEEQKAEALRLGREREFFKRRHEAWKRSIQSNPIYPSFTSGQLYEFYKAQFEVDNDNITVVENLCHYFAGDNRFDGDLNKGLLLAGGVGVGKSSLMQFFSRNQVYSYRMVSCRTVESDFDKNGYEAVEVYSNNLPIAVNGNPFGHQIVGYCFDDIGTEQDGKHFGKNKNMMTEIILNRYDRKLPKNSTHLTTNQTANAMLEAYGKRATDRLREMMNIIEFPPNAKSRRK